MDANRAKRFNKVKRPCELPVLIGSTGGSADREGRDRQTAIATLESQLQSFQVLVDAIPQGLCYFDSKERLLLSNRRYSEIYGLAGAQICPGMTLQEIVSARTATGTCAMPAEDYLLWCASVTSGAGPKHWTAALADGRTILIHHQTVSSGGWVATHEDVTGSEANRINANERMSLRALIDCVPDYLWVKDVESRFIIANKALATDCAREKATEMIGLTDFDIHPASVAEEFRSIELGVLRSGQAVMDREEQIVDAFGKRKWILSTKVPVRDHSDHVIGLVGIARDITARKLAESWRDGQAEILEMIATGGLLQVVLERLIQMVEAQLSDIVASVLLVENGTRLRHGAAPNLAAAYVNAIDGVEIGPTVGSCGTAAYRREPVIVSDIKTDPLWDEFRDLATAHGYRSCWSIPILAQHGHALGTFAMYSSTAREPTLAETRLFEAVTRIAGIAIERKQAENRIQFMASHDALTGLPNRTLLDDRLAQAVLYAERYDRWVSVVFVDLDNFKLVNDSLGHGAGDELLQIVASRMVHCLGPTDTVVRFGGDEFVIVLFNQPKSAHLVSSTVLKIKEAITTTLQLDGRDVHVTGSFGIANYPDDGTDPKTLLANADAAMYRAKENGRDNCQFFTSDLNEKAQKKLLMQEDLRNAIVRSEFNLVYQPQIHLRTGKIFAVEALLRWNHPKLGLVAPNDFIPLAEESGLIVQIGDWVLHEACRQNKEWQDAGLPHIRVCVNVSARQFRDALLTERVTSALQTSGLLGSYLELELTESLVMKEVDVAIAAMRRLQDLNVQMAIDDFGTGYSSLSALKTFPVSRLKIDKSFIGDLSTSEDDRAVTAAVISLGQQLKLKVIAEGVETEEQATFLRDNNCDEVQGYLFSKPVQPSEIPHLIAEKSTERRFSGPLDL